MQLHGCALSSTLFLEDDEAAAVQTDLSIILGKYKLNFYFPSIQSSIYSIIEHIPWYPYI